MTGTFKKQIGALVFAVTVVLPAGCRKDSEVNAILATIDSFTVEIINRIEMATNPSTGVDNAQKYLDSRHVEIAAKLKTLKELSGDQVSDETKQKMKASLIDDSSRLGSLQVKYVTRSISDPEFKAKLDKLVDDYQTLLTR